MRTYLILILSLLLSAYAAYARNEDILFPKDSVALEQIRAKMDVVRETRPTVALVLSGGGAKGIAHIGVIRYIEELDIPVDMVLGTSMGGLVGGLYALGYNSTQLDSLVKSMDWTEIMQDKIPRKYKSYAEVKYNEKYVLSFPFYYDKSEFERRKNDGLKYSLRKPIDLGADENSALSILRENLIGSLPSGYISGQNVGNTISGLTVGYQDSINFNNLPVPYACIATDLVSGKGYVWHSGKIVDAMRSTMSIPGIFEPVKVNGMVLVDGGMRDNYPTSLAKEMGADIVIGVDVSSKSLGYDEINNFGGIVSSGIDMLGRVALAENMKISDVNIKPELDGYGMLDFDNNSVAIILERGYEAGVANADALAEIKALMQSSSHKFQSSDAYISESDSIYISRMSINGISDRERAVLMKKVRFNAGTKMTKSDIDELVSSIYGTQAFDYVTYELLGSREPFHLAIKCKKGPIHKVGLGMRFDSEEIVSMKLNLGFNTQRLSGSKFNVDARLSVNPHLQLHYSYDSPMLPTINATATVRWTDVNMIDFAANKTELSYLYVGEEVYISNLNWTFLDTKLGLRSDYFDIRSILSSGQILDDYSVRDLRNNYLSVYVNMKNETFDNGYFPTKGYRLNAAYDWTFAAFPHPIENYHTALIDFEGVISIKDKFFITPSFYARYLFNHSMCSTSR